MLLQLLLIIIFPISRDFGKSKLWKVKLKIFFARN